MKIYDCFLFFNELLLLEVRLNELDPYVDYFVLVECCENFRGDPKPFYFEENKDKFRKFLNKIIHVKVEDRYFGQTWDRQVFQRNCIKRGLNDLNEEDVVLISDLDEIPRGEKIAEGLPVLGRATEFIIQGYAHFINRRVKRIHPRYQKLGGENHNGTVAVRFSDFTNAEDVRRLSGKFSSYRSQGKIDQIEEGGWHFSWMGDLDAITLKAASVSGHTAVNDPKMSTERWKEEQEILKRGGEGLVGVNSSGTAEFSIVPLDQSYPRYILDNLEKFEDWIYKK